MLSFMQLVKNKDLIQVLCMCADDVSGIGKSALFIQCGAHTLSLVIADAAESSTDTLGFFGILQ